MKKHLLILMVLFTHSLNSQTIYKIWHSEDDGICMNFKEKGYSAIDYENLIKLKVKNNSELKIYLYKKAKGIFKKRWVSKFKILKLTDDYFVIERFSGKNYFEFPNEKITFKSVNENCLN